MQFSLDIFKKHPYMTAIGAVVVFVIVYLALKGSGGNDSSMVVSQAGASQTDLQMAQLQAAQNQTQMQTGAALQVAQINAGVQMAQIGAQQQSTDAQTAAALAAIQAQTNAQVAINTAAYNAQVSQTQSMADVIKDQYDQQTARQALTVDYLNNLTNAQASVANNQIDATKTILTQQQQNAYDLNQATLSHVKDMNGSQNRLSLLLSTQGNYQGSIAAVNAQTASSISGDNLLANIGRASSSALATILG